MYVYTTVFSRKTVNNIYGTKYTFDVLTAKKKKKEKKKKRRAAARGGHFDTGSVIDRLQRVDHLQLKAFFP